MSATAIDVRTEAPRADQYVLFGIAAGCLAVFALLGVFVSHVIGPMGLDDVLGLPGNESEVLLRRLALLGSPQFVFTGVLATAIVALALRDYGGVVICAVGPTLAALIGLLAKHVIDRPLQHAQAYPSGHATLAVALATTVVVIAYRSGGPGAAAFLAVPAAVIPALVAVAVVRMGWHYPTDVVGGTALAVGVVCGTAAVFGGVHQRA